MIRLAAILALALAPLAVAAHPTGAPHVHGNDPTLWMGLGMLAVLTVLALLVKRGRA